jgi:hypothetical protein
LIVLAVPLALVVVVGASAVPTTQAAASGPAPSTARRRFEIQFMKRTIDHHFMAVPMAEQCVTKARHEAPRPVCGDRQGTGRRDPHDALVAAALVRHGPQAPARHE